MAGSQIAKLAEIRKKISQLAAQRDAAIARIADLESHVSDLESDLTETREALDRAKLDAEFLTVSHRLADTPEALVVTRRKILSLIRKVDSAINLLKNDPAE